MNEPAVVRLSGISHGYGRTIALNDVTLELPAGRMLGLIGPGGVGKSTLLGLITGALDRRTSGRGAGGTSAYQVTRAQHSKVSAHCGWRALSVMVPRHSESRGKSRGGNRRAARRRRGEQSG